MHVQLDDSVKLKSIVFAFVSDGFSLALVLCWLSVITATTECNKGSKGQIKVH